MGGTYTVLTAANIVNSGLALDPSVNASRWSFAVNPTSVTVTYLDATMGPPDVDNASGATAIGDVSADLNGTLIAVAPTVGLARVVSAAPELALALGYDVDAALEAPGEDAA